MEGRKERKVGRKGITEGYNGRREGRKVGKEEKGYKGRKGKGYKKDMKEGRKEGYNGR